MPINTLRVATFNIQHGRGPDGRVDLQRLADACAGLDVDILGLQEVDVGIARSQRADLASLIAEAAGMHATFGAAMTLDNGEYGNALLTRSAPSGVRVIRLPAMPHREPRAALLAAVDGVSVAVTHLSVGTDQHAAQLAAVAEALAARAAPRLILGDFNHEHPELPGYTVAASPPTWPASDPHRRLDHIAAARMTITDVVALELPVSDHRALLATLSREN